MDKHSPKISIKVNGTETTYVEREKQPAGEAAVLPKIEAPNNIVPFRAEHEAAMSDKRTARTGKRIAVTVGAAVLLGTGFGVTVLHMLSGSEQEQKIVPAAVTAVNPQPAAQPKKEASASSVTLQPIQAYVMQGAVFSTKEKGQASIEEWKKKGVPASLRTKDGKFYLLTAVGNDEQAVKAIGGGYEAKGAVSYFKPWSIEQKEIPKDYEKYASLLVKTEGLLAAILQQSSLCFTSGKTDEKEWARIEKDVQAVVKEGKNVDKEAVKKLLTYTSLSYDALKDYKTKKNSETFTKLQQLLLDGLTSYEGIAAGAENP